MNRRINQSEAASRLGVAHGTVRKLAETHVLHAQKVNPRTVAYDAEEVSRLEAFRAAPTDEQAFVVRMGAPGTEAHEGGSRPIGWDNDAIVTDPSRNEVASRMYWPAPDVERLRDCPLVAQVGPFTVGVWNIKAWTPHQVEFESGRIERGYEFHVEPATPKQLRDWENTRLDLGQGSKAVVVNPRSTTTTDHLKPDETDTLRLSSEIERIHGTTLEELADR